MRSKTVKLRNCRFFLIGESSQQISLVFYGKEKPLYTQYIVVLAERAGFEPAVPVTVRSLSKRVPSAAQPSLRIARFVRAGFVLFNCRSRFAALPLIDHVFRKAEFVRHRNDFSVVQRRFAVKLSEHLVLICG